MLELAASRGVTQSGFWRKLVAHPTLVLGLGTSQLALPLALSLNQTAL